MQLTDLRIGHVYAFPVAPGPWCRHAVPARVLARGPNGRVMVVVPDGVPASPVREAVPRGALVWVGADSLACSWAKWPERAAQVRESTLVAVSSAVAAIGGPGVRVLAGSDCPDPAGALGRARTALNRWARPEPRHPAAGAGG